MNTENKVGESDFLVSLGGDLSASRQSVGYILELGEKVMSIEFVWPATGTPVGTFRVGFCNIDTQSTAEDHPYCTSVTSPAKPAGVAGRAFIDRIKTAARLLVVSYDATSGGTGCLPTIKVAR